MLNNFFCEATADVLGGFLSMSRADREARSFYWNYQSRTQFYENCMRNQYTSFSLWALLYIILIFHWTNKNRLSNFLFENFSGLVILVRLYIVLFILIILDAVFLGLTWIQKMFWQQLIIVCFLFKYFSFHHFSVKCFL